MAEFNNLTPITRREQFLQDIADGTVDKTPITREEWFLAQIAEAVAHGGGGGLPSYTSADIDKVLSVKQLVVDENVPWLAEQSVTLESGNSLVTVLSDLPEDIEDGTVGVLSVSQNGEVMTPINMVWSSADSGFISDNPSGIVGYNLEASAYYIGIDLPDGTYTVSMYYVWPTPQYDVVTAIPEQTVTISESAVFVPNYDEDFFNSVKNGDTAVLTVNDVEFNVVATVVNGLVTFAYNNAPPMIGYGPNLGCAFAATEAGEYTISLVANLPTPTIAWSFKESGAAGITPNGDITVSVTGGVNGSSVTVIGVFKKVTGDVVEYEQGSHTFEYAQVPIGEPGYSVAVPTVGEGDEEHIDCYFAFSSTSNGSPAATGVNTTSNAATFARMKNSSNQNQNVWHLVTANGTKTATVTAQFYYS